MLLKDKISKFGFTKPHRDLIILEKSYVTTESLALQGGDDGGSLLRVYPLLYSEERLGERTSRVAS